MIRIQTVVLQMETRVFLPRRTMAGFLMMLRTLLTRMAMQPQRTMHGNQEGRRNRWTRSLQQRYLIIIIYRFLYFFSIILLSPLLLTPHSFQIPRHLRCTFTSMQTMQKYGRTMNHADLAAMQEEGRKRKKGLKRKEHVKRTSAGPRNTAHDLSATMHTMRSSRQSSALSSSTGMSYVYHRMHSPTLYSHQ